jgi:hypothetical protein
MDYQASSSSSKVSFLKTYSRIKYLFVVLTLLFLPFVVQATTTNPLIEGVSMSAIVLERYLGGGGSPPLPPFTEEDSVLFKGIAYPMSVVSLLKNGVIVREATTREDGSFALSIQNLSSGTYNFGIRAQDPNKLKSKLLLFTVYVSQTATTIVDGIFIPPTITSDKIEVKKGDIIAISGFSVPSVEVRLSLTSKVDGFTELLKKTNANNTGAFVYALDTTSLPQGDYFIKAKSISSKDSSPYGEELSFTVGLQNKLRTKTNGLLGFRKRCDLNDDNRVNLLDFSIMAFWYKRLGFPDKVDLNSDAKINLTDLSILAYCWTG